METSSPFETMAFPPVPGLVSSLDRQADSPVRTQATPSFSSIYRERGASRTSGARYAGKLIAPFYRHPRDSSGGSLAGGVDGFQANHLAVETVAQCLLMLGRPYDARQIPTITWLWCENQSELNV